MSEDEQRGGMYRRLAVELEDLFHMDRKRSLKCTYADGAVGIVSGLTLDLQDPVAVRHLTAASAAPEPWLGS
jgi:hypothetical protein